MTSDARIAANRNNARRSTGPRTREGKQRAARNALTHGLAADLLRDPAIVPEIERLAAAMAGERASPERRALGAILAAAQLDLWRVRAARAGLIDRAAAEQAHRRTSAAATPGAPPDAATREAEAIRSALPGLVRLDRYERRALSRRNRALRRLQALWQNEPNDAAGA